MTTFLKTLYLSAFQNGMCTIAWFVNFWDMFLHLLTKSQWGAFYLFIANFFVTQIIGGAKELVILL